MKKTFLIISAIVALILFTLLYLYPNKKVETMKISSSSFQNNERIPSKYTCDGENLSPALDIEGIPANAKSLVLILDDPDSPSGTWDHWILFNTPITGKILEDSIPQGAIQGKNTWGKSEYGGPCPGSGTHHYKFKLYALDTTLNLDEKATKSQVESAMKSHILAQASLTGFYKRG